MGGSLHTFLAIGAPLMDYIVWVPDHLIDSLQGEKGGMEPVELSDFHSLLDRVGTAPILAAGGSQANTLKGLAQLGHQCRLIGMIGNDSIGKRYRELIESVGVECRFMYSENTGTGRVLSMVTPDGERTMRSYLGASAEVASDLLTPEAFRNTELLHLSAYSFYEREVIAQAVSLAKQAGLKVSLSLASFEVVKEFKEQIWSLLPSGVDFIFANAEEAHALCGSKGEEACTLLSELCECVVIHEGERGACAKKGREYCREPALPVTQVKDSTGAGDLFTAGFLHGYFTGQSLSTCIRLGNACGAEAVQEVGAELSFSTWQKIKN